MDECIFCAEVRRKDANIFMQSKSGLLAARWDRFPATPGHAEIIPMRHVQFLKDLTAEEQAELMAFAVKVTTVIESTDLKELYRKLREQFVDDISDELLEKAIAKLHDYADRKPDAYNYGINDGPVAGQSVGHTHLHIMPRWQGDIANPRGGVRNIFADDLYSQS